MSVYAYDGMSDTRDLLVGRKIVGVRAATAGENKALGLYVGKHTQPVFVLELDDKTVVMLMSDAEGNGAGFPFVYGPNWEVAS